MSPWRDIRDALPRSGGMSLKGVAVPSVRGTVHHSTMRRWTHDDPDHDPEWDPMIELPLEGPYGPVIFRRTQSGRWERVA